MAESVRPFCFRARSPPFREALIFGLQEGNRALSVVDPEIAALIGKEKSRQIEGLELIASEVRARRTPHSIRRSFRRSFWFSSQFSAVVWLLVLV